MKHNGQFYQREEFKLKKLIETLIEEMKPVIVGDEARWVWMSRKVTGKTFFEKIRTNRTPVERTNSMTCHLPLYHFYVLNRVLDGEIGTCTGWGKQVSKLSKIKKLAHPGKFGLSRHWCQEHKLTNVPSKNFLPIKSFDGYPYGRDRVFGFGEMRVLLSRKVKTNLNPLEFLNIQDNAPREKTMVFNSIPV